MKLIYIYALLLSGTILLANSPKREMRGVWLTTVAGIDFPNTVSTDDQKKEIRNILDKYQDNGINAVFFQVRPTSDALYVSALEPWSRYLTGRQGQAPTPFYDPLSYIIEEAHKRNLELHAWINPFRVRLNTTDRLCSWHPYVKHPDWGWNYGGKTYYDPGVPEVREHTKKVVLDITQRYDIDGIHFDDYFYPYIVDRKTIPDQATFKKYGEKYYPAKIEDWRRHNIDEFIADVNQEIKETKPWVKFGVSPFGIWKNSKSKGDGFPTRSDVSNYDMLYADVVKWMKEGWIDYCAPQLYWAIGYRYADYAKLLAWWDNHSYGRNIYVGHSLYKIDSESKELAWRSPQEIERQIDALRNSKNFSGSIFYSSKHLTERADVQPLRTALNEKYYKDYAFTPSMPWIDNKAPQSPRNVSFHPSYSGNTITWEEPKYRNIMNKVNKYIIYKADVVDGKFYLKAEDIIDITKDTSYNLANNAEGGYYAITALDRLQNESKAQVVYIDGAKMTSVVFLRETVRRIFIQTKTKKGIEQ